ncbi:MAG: hypothetical protein LJU34_03260, partial [Oscillospiraceae bacterium]|nr:hypothetical protein [Oscillospiraceae bacterium]
MSDRHHNDLTPDYGEYSLESILDDYRKADDGEKPAPSAESIAQRSRQRVSASFGEALREAMSQYREAPAQPETPVSQDDGEPEADETEDESAGELNGAPDAGADAAEEAAG